ncbi:MAG: hypothetical protein LDL31_04980, partial [Prosthecobacter sp.]|nr:hypothetical protein [Prosthecobacter sp.]
MSQPSRLVALSLWMGLSTTHGQSIELVKDVNTTPPAASAHVESMIFAAGRLFISADDPVSGAELWTMSIPSSFNTPSAAAVDADGNVYVVDTPNHTIRRISPSGMVSTFAGRPGVSGGDNGAGLSATFNAPEGIAADGVGNLYVADTGNHVIRRINRDGIVTTLAGQIGTLGTNNGTGPNARFRNPRGVTVNNAGTLLYVADSGNHTLRRITMTTTPAAPGTAETVTANVSLWAGTAGSTGSVDGTGSAARFNNPTALSIDNAGFLYVADTGNHLLRRVNAGGTVSLLAGTAGTAGSQNGTGAAATFNAPRGIVVDPAGTVAYVCDSGSHTLRRVTSAGVVTTLAGLAGVAGFVNGTGAGANFNTPRGIALRSGTLYVADALNHVVRTVAAASGAAGLLAGRAGVQGAEDSSAVPSGSTTPTIIKDIFPGADGSAPARLTSVGNRLFFTAQDSSGQRDLWVTDGTSTGTQRITTSTFYPNPPGDPDNLTEVNGALFFTGYSSQEGLELWRATVASNGAVTAALVKDVNPEPSQGSSSSHYFNAGGTLLFSAFGGAADGTELWKSNGTSAGTVRLADIFPGSSDSNPSRFTIFGDRVFFSAQGVTTDTGETVEPVGRELYSSLLPSLNAISLVRDIAAGGSDSDPQEFVISGSDPARGANLFFTASTVAEGRELWVINGSTG